MLAESRLLILKAMGEKIPLNKYNAPKYKSFCEYNLILIQYTHFTHESVLCNFKNSLTDLIYILN